MSIIRYLFYLTYNFLKKYHLTQTVQAKSFETP